MYHCLRVRWSRRSKSPRRKSFSAPTCKVGTLPLGTPLQQHSGHRRDVYEFKYLPCRPSRWNDWINQDERPSRSIRPVRTARGWRRQIGNCQSTDAASGYRLAFAETCKSIGCGKMSSAGLPALAHSVAKPSWPLTRRPLAGSSVRMRCFWRLIPTTTS